MHNLRPDLKSMITLKDDAKETKRNQYRFTSQIAPEATRNILEFYHALGAKIKAIITIQESSAESERFFSFSERAV